MTKLDFQIIMRRLPVELEEEVIDDMFEVADKNGDGKIGFDVNFECIVTYKLLNNFQEFHAMINPPPLPVERKPTKLEIYSILEESL